MLFLKYPSNSRIYPQVQLYLMDSNQIGTSTEGEGVYVGTGQYRLKYTYFKKYLRDRTEWNDNVYSTLTHQ